jgi:hypothetical protein
MMDCFAHYNRQNAPLRSSFTEGQLEWLRADLAATSARQWRLVFAHYDYHKQLPPLLPELRVDALFYGHAKGMYPEALAAHGIWDGHLDDIMAYNLVRLMAEGITSEKVSWGSLETSVSASSGRRFRATANCRASPTPRGVRQSCA